MSTNNGIEAVLAAWTKQALISSFDGVSTEIDVPIISTNDEKFGDFQCNIAMGLARELKCSPRDIASKMVQSGPPPKEIEKIEIAGPGFINFFVTNKALDDALASIQYDVHFGVPQEGKNKTVVIDYSSPNVAKPMHIGHIRSTVIGNAIDRLYRALGYTVVSDNHLGDWGTQFGLMLIGFRAFADHGALEESPIDELERIYVESYNRSKEDETWREKAKAELVKLQQGDEENRALWSQFVQWSMQEFSSIYERLDIQFDLFRGESYYNEALPTVISQLEEKGITQESEGALIVNLEEQGMPVCIVRKSDGGYNYATTDIATVQSRQEEFNPVKIIYVTDERQQLHFKQFFCICEQLEIKANLEHVWFGLMRLPEATFSTREGNVIKLKALLDEAANRARSLVETHNPNADESQKADLAETIGISAIKYMDLSQNPQSLVTFTWDKALAMDGNSAPYLLYAYARISSVCDKYIELYGDQDLAKASICIDTLYERRLALKLLRFGQVVEQSAQHYKPNVLCDYLYELSQLYSSYYQNVPFLKADAGVREQRIKLCGLIAQVLKRGLHLLGIQTRDRI